MIDTQTLVENIRAHRAAYGSSLKAAKHAVEAGWRIDDNVEGYTLDQIDDAMREIMGESAVRPGDYGWNRTTAMLQAASTAWVAQRSEDQHSARLRAAIRDLNRYGYMKPSEPAGRLALSQTKGGKEDE